MLIIKIGDVNSVMIYINSMYTFVLLQMCMTFLILWTTNNYICIKHVQTVMSNINMRDFGNIFYFFKTTYIVERGNRIGQDHKPGFELNVSP